MNVLKELREKANGILINFSAFAARVRGTGSSLSHLSFRRIDQVSVVELQHHEPLLWRCESRRDRPLLQIDKEE